MAPDISANKKSKKITSIEWEKGIKITTSAECFTESGKNNDGGKTDTDTPKSKELCQDEQCYSHEFHCIAHFEAWLCK